MKPKIKPSPLTGKPCEDCAGTGKRLYDGERKRRVCTACEGTGDANAETDSQCAPLPWTQGAAGEIWFDGEVVAVSSAPDLSDVGYKIRGERAARIVRAVNSHAGLVAALTALANVTGEKGMDKTVLSSLVAEARTALRAAGEEV